MAYLKNKKIIFSPKAVIVEKGSEQKILEGSDYIRSTVAESLRGYLFYEDSLIKDVDFPNVLTIEQRAFSKCSNLTSISFPNAETVGESGFAVCSLLVDIEMPKVKTIAGGAFQYCDAITEIDFPLLQTIAIGGFYGCTSLTSAYLASIKSLDASAFYNCSSLTKLVIESPTVATLANVNALADTPIASGTGFIYVPDDLVESYKTAANWSTYAAQIKSINELGE